MNDNKTSKAGETGLALRKNIKLTGSLIAAAATLCAGLAGDVQAIPISMHDDLDAGMGPWTLSHEKSHYEAAYSFDRINQNQGLGSPTVFHLVTSVPLKIAGETHGLGSKKVHHHKPGVTVTPPAAIVPPREGVPSAASVADGGSTGLMMGGVFCGLALLRKKLKA
jgi:hypothetical protein